MVKSKLTVQYILSLGVISIIIVFLNIFAGAYMIYRGSAISGKEKEVDVYTRDFEKNIELKGGRIEINDLGKKSLSEKKLWIQILDENGKETGGFNVPLNTSRKYTPLDIVNAYKYGGYTDGDSEVLFGSKKINGKEYTYLIGFPMKHMRKYTIVVDNETFFGSSKKIMTVLAVVDLTAAIALGYIFSKRLTNPIEKIIFGIENLADGGEYKELREKGIYEGVFHQMNELANKLKENEVERLKTLNMRKEWIANISHDIKTPLASINGYAELMDGSYSISQSEMKKYAKIIHQKSDYIKELVEDLNLTMKLETDGHSISRKNVNIVSVVREAVIEILNDPIYSDVEVEMKSEEEIIKSEVDEKLIKRAVSNLIYNSIIHNNIDVNIKVEIFRKNNLHIVISDDGKGIEEEDIDKIFDRYYRGTSTGEAHKGSGLGMAIVKDIVESHGGNIKIESSKGRGVISDIELP